MYIHWSVYITGMAASRPSTRERIVASAQKLFYEEGVRAVSLDAVAENAGVTKRTLYYHFESKDDLVAAYLEARDQPNLAFFRKCFEEAEGDVADRTAGIFQKIARAARHPRWKGCGFLRTSAELVKLPGHPAMIAARAHKKRVEDWLLAIFTEAGAENPTSLARQILVLLDGAFASTLLQRDAAYVEAAAKAAEQIVRAGLPPARKAR